MIDSERQQEIDAWLLTAIESYFANYEILCFVYQAWPGTDFYYIHVQQMQIAG